MEYAERMTNPQRIIVAPGEGSVFTDSVKVSFESGDGYEITTFHGEYVHVRTGDAYLTITGTSEDLTRVAKILRQASGAVVTNPITLPNSTPEAQVSALEEDIEGLHSLLTERARVAKKIRARKDKLEETMETMRDVAQSETPNDQKLGRLIELIDGAVRR